MLLLRHQRNQHCLLNRKQVQNERHKKVLFVLVNSCVAENPCLVNVVQTFDERQVEVRLLVVLKLSRVQHLLNQIDFSLQNIVILYHGRKHHIVVLFKDFILCLCQAEGLAASWEQGVFSDWHKSILGHQICKSNLRFLIFVLNLYLVDIP